MKYLLTIVLFGLLTSTSYPQTWKNYFGGNYIYGIDKIDSILVVGVDHQVVAINTVTGENRYLMPPANNRGECLAYENVAIDGDFNIWIGGDFLSGAGLYKYSDSSWQHYTISNSTLPYNYLLGFYMDHSSNTFWLESGNITGTFSGTDFDSLGNYYGPKVNDKFNNLWIAQYETGLIKYDGNSFTIYNNANSDLQLQSIKNITADSTGKIWFSLEKTDEWGYDLHYSIGTFDGINWVEYTIENSNLPYINNILNLGMDANNRLVIASNDGLTEFDGTNATEFNYLLGNFPDVNITVFFVDNEGKQYIGTSANGLLERTDTTINYLTTSEFPMVGNQIHDILLDNTGKIYAGVGCYYDYAESMIIKDDSTWTVFHENYNNQPGSAYSICMDNNGAVILLGKTGLYKFFGNNWQRINFYNPYASVYRVGIDVDSHGIVWIGSDGSLKKCNGYSTTYIYPPGDNVIIQGVTVDESDNIWLANFFGISKFDGHNTWVNYDYTNTIPDMMYGARNITFDNNGVLWAAGKNLLSFDGTTWVSYPHPDVYLVSDVAIDGGNNKWVSFLGGLARFNGTDWIIFNHENSPLLDDYVREIDIDVANNTLWGTTSCGGFFSLQDSSLVVSVKKNPVPLKSNQFTLYPNPASGKVFISTNGLDHNYGKVSILSFEGKQIYSGIIDQSDLEIDISGIPAGIYLVRVQNTELCVTRKLVIVGQ
jgi:ligand-binding sensor domain-containing protein